MPTVERWGGELMNLGLRGKVALVTGGSRGIGRSIALGLAEEECRLVICARGSERLEATAGELRSLGAEVLAITADMTTEAGRQVVFDGAVNAFGRVDILVNNVGGGGGPTFMDTTEEQWEAAFDLTLWPSVHLSR